MDKAMNRWQIAGQFMRVIPDVRGSDRLLAKLRGPGVPTRLGRGPTQIALRTGSKVEVEIEADGSFESLYFAQYRDPALVPILEATLRPGDRFFDVGANIGIYSLWAAHLVGPAGGVVSFEPSPLTRSWLLNLIKQAGLDNITVDSRALSSGVSDRLLQITPAASGLSSIVDEMPADPAGCVSVSTVALDDVVQTYGAPSLVKVDVEGHEEAVVAGMSTTLSTSRPVVVFESPDTVGRIGSTDRIAKIFAGHSYGVFALTTKGLKPFGVARSHNYVALSLPHHDEIFRRLKTTKFRRNQNC